MFENGSAKDFWRTILNGSGPDTPLTRIVDEGDQAMKVTLACVFLLLPLHASPQEPQKPTEEKSAAESKSTSETAKQVNPVKPSSQHPVQSHQGRSRTPMTARCATEKRVPAMGTWARTCI
jgi:hypothetical protein